MKIKWTTLAHHSFEEEINFILQKWTSKEAAAFVQLVNDFINKLLLNPFMGKKSSKKDLYAFVLSKQTTVFYQVFKDKNRIDIQLFWNNLRNPEDLENILLFRRN